MKNDAVILKPKDYLPLPVISDDWNYEESVKKVKRLLRKKEGILAKTMKALKVGRMTALKILNEKKSLIYFIQSENGLIKIGSCYDIATRLSTLQIGSPIKLTVVGIIERADITEKELHKIFNYCRSHGEWFFPDKMLLEFIIKEKNGQ